MSRISLYVSFVSTRTGVCLCVSVHLFMCMLVFIRMLYMSKPNVFIVCMCTYRVCHNYWITHAVDNQWVTGYFLRNELLGRLRCHTVLCRCLRDRLLPLYHKLVFLNKYLEQMLWAKRAVGKITTHLWGNALIEIIETCTLVKIGHP